jgi:hypothetical protein
MLITAGQLDPGEADWRKVRVAIRVDRLAARGRDVLRMLAERGVTLPVGGRLERAVQRLERVGKNPEMQQTMSDQDADLFLEAMRDVSDAYLVVWAAVECPRTINPFPNDRLSSFGGGTDSPTGEANPKARNTQFELVVGAHFLLGGADVRPEEPDYSLLYHGRRVGLAVKRLTSINPNTLGTRLREAADQISTTFGEGFAVVNLDGWISDLAGASAEEVGRKFMAQLNEAYDRMIKLVAPKDGFLGVFILGNGYAGTGMLANASWSGTLRFTCLASATRKTSGNSLSTGRDYGQDGRVV